MTKTTFRVVEAFNIDGRGVVLVGDRHESGVVVMKECKADIVTPDGKTLHAVAFKEWLLRRTLPKPDETEAFLVRDKTEAEIPIGSQVTITQG